MPENGSFLRGHHGDASRTPHMCAQALLSRVRIGMTRGEVAAALGPPDDVGCISRKHRIPSIYLYGRIELHFEPWESGVLTTVYIEDVGGDGRVMLGRMDCP